MVPLACNFVHKKEPTVDTPDLSGISEEEIVDFLAYQEKMRGTDINEQTLLATDYLNHFNEIVMTLEMVPDMP